MPAFLAGINALSRDEFRVRLVKGQLCLTQGDRDTRTSFASSRTRLLCLVTHTPPLPGHTHASFASSHTRLLCLVTHASSASSHTPPLPRHTRLLCLVIFSVPALAC